MTWKSRQRNRTTPALFAALFLVMISFAVPAANADHALSKSTDLTNSELESGGRVTLDGSWNFYWRRFIPASEFVSAPIPEPDHVLHRLRMWNGLVVGEELLRAEGFATYHLRFVAPDIKTPLALRIPEQNMALAVFANGKLIGGSGTVGRNADEETARSQPLVVDLPNDGHTIDLVLHISNHYHMEGGARHPIVVGTASDLKADRIASAMARWGVSGALLMIGLIALGVTLIMGREGYMAAIGGLAIVLGLRFITTAKLQYFLWPDAPALWSTRSEYIGLFLMGPLYIAFVHNLFPTASWKWPPRIIAVLGVACCIFTLYAHPLWFTSLRDYGIITGLGGLVFAFFLALRAKLRNLTGAGLVALSIGLALATALNDSLHYMHFIYTGDLTPVGMMAVVLILGLVAGVRISRSYDRESRLKQVFDSAPVPIYLVDPEDGEVMFASKRATISAANWLVEGRLLQLSFWPQLKDFYEGHAELFRNDGIAEIEIDATDTSKVPAALHVSASSLLYGDSKALCITVTDVTRRREAEAALQKAKETAEAATRAKSEFLAVMSHEIRTPMNGVLGLIELLDEVDLPAKARGFVSHLMRASRHMSDLLNNILDLSKIDLQGQDAAAVKFRIEETLRDVTEMFEAQAQAKNIVLRTEINIPTGQYRLGDAQTLRQILANLIGNAVKFTESGEIVVSVSGGIDKGPGSSQPNDEYIFRVRDSGIGIPRDKLGQIFEPFTQADGQMGSDIAGSGLGLAITKQLVERLGGEISVVSDLGHGSIFDFRLRLPAVESAPAGVARITASPIRLQGARILIADDSELGRLVITEYLRAFECEIEEAVDGRQAVDKFSAGGGTYDAVLMDMRMPELDGTQAIREIRRTETERSWEPVPIIVQSANAFEEDRESALEAGSNMFLAKPVRKKALLEALLEVLGKPKVLADSDIGDEPGNEIDHLLPLFFEATHESIRDLSAAANAKEFDQFPDILHTARGRAGMFQFNELDRIFLTIDKAYTGGEFDRITDLVAEARVMLDDLENARQARTGGR